VLTNRHDSYDEVDEDLEQMRRGREVRKVKVERARARKTHVDSHPEDQVQRDTKEESEPEPVESQDSRKGVSVQRNEGDDVVESCERRTINEAQHQGPKEAER